ncbi:MAG TPA: hypothetical protein VMS64_26340 [Candidatus Methylomirabilis sp.]|nr:hypothetical protein [Candidatus Methylomirabilis sp.]
MLLRVVGQLPPTLGPAVDDQMRGTVEAIGFAEIGRGQGPLPIFL